jgi:hypothetical protein
LVLRCKVISAAKFFLTVFFKLVAVPLGCKVSISPVSTTTTIHRSLLDRVPKILMRTTSHQSNPLANLLVIVALTLAGAAQSSRAATYLWNVATPGANYWNVNADWTPATGNPGPGDTAVFGAIGTSANATVKARLVSQAIEMVSQGVGVPTGKNRRYKMPQDAS